MRHPKHCIVKIGRLLLASMISWAVNCQILQAQDLVFLDDSLRIQAETTMDPVLKIACLNRMGYLILDGGDKEGSMALFRQADSMARVVNDPVGLAFGTFYRGMLAWDAHDTLAAEKLMMAGIDSLDMAGVELDLYSPLAAMRLFYNITGRYEDKRQFYEQRLERYTQSGRTRNLGACLHGLANYYNILGYTEKAIEYYTRAALIWKEEGNTTCTASMLVVLAKHYLEWGSPVRAMELFNAARELPTRKVAMVAVLIYKRQMAELSLAAGDPENALNHFRTIDTLRHRLSRVNAVISDLNMASACIALSYSTDVNIKANEKNLLDTAKIFIDRAGSVLNQYPFPLWAANGDVEYNRVLADWFTRTGNKGDALERMKQALDQARREQYSKLILRYLDTLSAMASRMGDPAAAYAYLHEHRYLRDSLDRASQAGRVARYETELKEREIEELNRNRKLQEAEIERQWFIRRIFGGAFLAASVFAFVFLRQRNRISRERRRSDELLRNILPDAVAGELRSKGKAEARHYDQVTVLFTDFKDFTSIAEGMPPSELVAELDTCFSAFDEITARHGLEKIKTIGDSYMCASGLPVPDGSHATKAVAAALEMLRFTEQRNGRLSEVQNTRSGVQSAGFHTPFQVRIGIHSGPVVAGIVGTRKFAYDIWGDTVNTASRMESAGEAGKINISGATRELVKNHFTTTLRGRLKVKNKGDVEMWWVEKEPVT